MCPGVPHSGRPLGKILEFEVFFWKGYVAMVAVNGGEPATKRLKSSDSASAVDDVRVVDCKPLIPPAILLEDIPLTEAGLATVAKVRANLAAIQGCGGALVH